MGAWDAVTVSAMDVEETLKRLEGHNGVEGLLVLSQPDGIVIRSTVEQEKTAVYASELKAIVDKAAILVRELEPSDELSFLRVRSKLKEILIAPDENYILIVVQALQ